jgi:hypothetical protein
VNAGEIWQMKNIPYPILAVALIGIAFMIFEVLKDAPARDATVREMEIDEMFRPDPNQTKDFSPDQLVDLFGDQSIRDITANAEHIDVLLINPKGLELKWGIATVSDYPVNEGPVRIPKHDVAAIKEALTDARSFGWNYGKSCLPAPGVRMTFTKDNQSVDVLYCFACNILGVYSKNKFVGGEDFDTIRPTLVRSLQRLYPYNRLIQGLPETGSGVTAKP